MIYNKNNLKIYPMASKDETRAELNGVLFKKDRTAATDSFCLIEVKNSKSLADSADVPTVPNGKVWANMPNDGVILPLKTVQKALKDLENIKNPALPVLENCWLSSIQAENVSIVSTDLDLANITQSRIVQGEYPKYQEIIPQDNDLRANYNKITIDINFLVKTLKTIQSMESADKAIELYCHRKDSNKSIVIKTKTEQAQDITAVIMPIRQ